MIITRYKPLFSFAAFYEAGSAVIADDLYINATAISIEAMYNFKLKSQLCNNTVTVYFEGRETPPNVPVNSIPAFTINTEEYFYFGITITGKEKIKSLKFHPNDAIAKEIGFPVLYNGLIPGSAMPPAVSLMDDVKVVAPIFTFIATQAQSGLSTDYAALVIKDEGNNTVNLNMPPVALSIDPISAAPQYVFNVDASLLKAGIYSLKTGNYNKKFFIANGMDIANTTSLVRILKNSFLGYNTNLADNSFAAFELVVPKI
ncbi:MAG: hypothetical protein JST21_01125 [Bacteroidetes bacterium]|nr:hypothetical protein [Bacteroidota bacterium]